MAGVTGVRWRVEEFFEDGKSDLGMADYQVRGWPGWHHHMTMVAMAHLYVTLVRKELGRDVPELTLDMALRMLQTVLPQPKLGPEHAQRVVEYHLKHNRRARESHRKSWLRRHKGKLKEPML